jgi:hypothetical protein
MFGRERSSTFPTDYQDFVKNHRFYLDDELIADSGRIVPDYLNE